TLSDHDHRTARSRLCGGVVLLHGGHDDDDLRWFHIAHSPADYGRYLCGSRRSPVLAAWFAHSSRSNTSAALAKTLVATAIPRCSWFSAHDHVVASTISPDRP